MIPQCYLANNNKFTNDFTNNFTNEFTNDLINKDLIISL